MNEPAAICNLLIIGITSYLSYRGFKSYQLEESLLFSSVRILRDREYYRLITSGFLHANWVHLFFNMFSMYSFGSHIELIFGFHTFLFIYLISILGGSLFSLFIHKNHSHRALGASGGVCGIIFASIFLLPHGSVMIFPVPIPISSWLYAILFILISSLGMFNQVGNIGHDAHLGGAMSGLVTATVLYPSIILHSPVLFSIVIGLSLLFFFYFPKHLSCSYGSKPFTYKHSSNIWSNLKGKLRSRKSKADEQALDRLLEKIFQSGKDSLTSFEKRKLKSIVKKKNNNWMH